MSRMMGPAVETNIAPPIIVSGGMKHAFGSSRVSAGLRVHTVGVADASPDHDDRPQLLGERADLMGATALGFGIGHAFAGRWGGVLAGVVAGWVAHRQQRRWR
jgi:hypothetical protein